MDENALGKFRFHLIARLRVNFTKRLDLKLILSTTYLELPNDQRLNDILICAWILCYKRQFYNINLHDSGTCFAKKNIFH